MKEEFVDYETAKLAYEKGFTVFTEYEYREDTLNNIELCHKSNCIHDHIINRCSVPTQSLLQKWLRDVHNFNITILCVNKQRKYIYVIPEITNKEVNHGIEYINYEEALKEGLSKALELIKQ